jgi:hypothetical protein
VRGDIQVVKHEIAMGLASPEFVGILAGVDTETLAPLQTPGPASIEGEKFVLSGQGFPVVEVVGIRTVYDSNAEQVKDATHEIQVMWTQVGDDELTITAQLERLVKATRDYFWPPIGPLVLPNVNACPIEIVSEEYSALMKGLTTPFVKGSATTLRVRTLTV